ncbi:MAG: class I SAM-dependent methyltransferase [Clostridia bacterium]|nr:class I SAM-dependent methyltransferase [Clostridia bacterium]
MQVMNEYKDYELLDMANGEKLEKWGKYLLIRPDPQVIWSKKESPTLWKKADARYIRSSSGGGHWEVINPLKESWQVDFGKLKFNIKPMGFKHTGLFPEQEVNWTYMREKIAEALRQNPKREIKVLNLFAYTGGATVACLSAGASVCHVDSSKGMVAWAKENVKSSGLEERPVRFIVDDVVKFVKREIKRGNKYDCIIMDPPSYGRGATGEVWNIDKDLENLTTLCVELLTDEPLFYIVNTYTGGLSGTIISNLLKVTFEEKRKDLLKNGNIKTNEIGIKAKTSGLILPCGITTKWEN